jgi:hypothetical protein
MTDAVQAQDKEAYHQARIAQMNAWAQFGKDHPIAARKARQKAEAEARKLTAINLHFGKIILMSRDSVE